MAETNTVWSFIPERRCEEADKPESVTRLPEGPILVDPYGDGNPEDCFYYKDFQSYLDDLPHIKKFINDTTHCYTVYDENNSVHQMIKEKSYLVIVMFLGTMLLYDVARNFKEATVVHSLPGGAAIPLQFLESDAFDKEERDSIIDDVINIIKEKN